ncbi:tol-pal system-associated acyl-CoA thioesterase [Methylovirgula sp. 4M-Z18]|uniref:tol-pal system-associated acyl-CoA thioesterase n=1 Tax=Methylovirgula sp. 4M-Z18 TaxID=2293567 RepID=UPI000E2FEF8D|nr:tol-pal system-associated acyl-CoA thioesterase [Methylovirgula sp. 4M-Z18]RFB76372.1 tol-pal system-associated acyl-CoA thioesterase [Methylovirgula sp. 4M-Z18]
MPEPHLLPIRVYYEDTDFSGVVYHASYLRFLERGRTELLRSLGIHQAALHTGETAGFAFAVRAMTIDFLKPARMDDLVTVETVPADIGGASVTLQQRILLGESVLIHATVRVAAVAGGKPVRLPHDVKVKLAGMPDH